MPVDSITSFHLLLFMRFLDNKEEQRDEDDKFEVATDCRNDRERCPRKWKVPIIAAVMLITYLSVGWFFSARDIYMESILVPT